MLFFTITRPPPPNNKHLSGSNTSHLSRFRSQMKQFPILPPHYVHKCVVIYGDGFQSSSFEGGKTFLESIPHPSIDHLAAAGCSGLLLPRKIGEGTWLLLQKFLVAANLSSPLAFVQRNWAWQLNFWLTTAEKHATAEIAQLFGLYNQLYTDNGELQTLPEYPTIAKQ